MTFVLVGGGPTGVELAASMAQMATVTLRGNFRRIDPAKTSIVLIEGGNRILPTFAESLSRKAARRLEKLGVKVLTGTKVEKVDEQGVVAGGKRIPSATVLVDGRRRGFAGREDARCADRSGRKAPGRSVLDGAGRQRRVRRRRCGCLESRRTAVAGRCPGGDPAGTLRRTADLDDSSKGEAPRRPFRYFDKGNMAVVGKNFAVLERGRIRTSGFITWLVWVFVHLMFLPQLQNRLRVQRQWFWSYWTGQRSSRLISEAAALMTARGKMHD